MNYKKIVKEAVKFQNEDEAYVHIEMKEKKPQIVASGSSVAIIYCVKILIDKVAKAGNTSPMRLLDAIKDMYNVLDSES